MKITIKDSEVELKSTMRAYLIYEQINLKAFEPTSLMEVLLYFYSVIMANKPSIELTFDDFIDYLDENPELINDFKNWIDEENKKASQFISEKSKKK